MAGFGRSPQFPFMYPGVYSPGQVAFNNNPEMSQLISMFSGPLLGALAGPGSFVPHMSPTQQLVDQFAMRNYQNQSRTAAYGIANDNTANLASRFMGIRSAFTEAAPTELNREQASNIAGIVNNPMAKMALGMAFGHDTVESMLHGSKGDISALQGQLSKIGYFRKDPSGRGRMDAESQMDYTRGVYAHMYEAQGNLGEIEAESRSSNARIREAGRQRLKKAAKREDATIVEDDEIVARMESMEDAPKRVEALYKKYVQGGTATDTKQQAQELVKLDRAVQASGQLKENEATVGSLVRRAERVPVNEMHGFTAGQAGQIAENMFQRGLLPQAVGSMSAADRVRMINQTPLDEETTRRLSREMARKDLEDKNNSSADARAYRSLGTEREKEEFVNQNAGKYEQKLSDTRKEIEKTASGASNAMSATELEKLQGFDSLAGNVDAKRSAEAIKKYTGAVAAVRDIFGDNGNPNAPLPALLAALEGLTGGAIGSMKPEKIQATLRQMQSVAKEAGIGFEQMAAMSTQIDSMGQAMNLTPADTMRLKSGAMSALKVMQDTGAFSNPLYGQMDKNTAGERAAELMTRGAASPVSKQMAAISAIYDADPSQFAGTQLEAAMKAYRNDEGDGTYTYTDKNGRQVTRNLREEIGKGGVGAVNDIAKNSGVTQTEIAAQRDNPIAMENANLNFAYLTQPYEAQAAVSRNSYSHVRDKLKKTSLFNGLDRKGEKDLTEKVSGVLSRTIFETSDLETEDQITEIQKTLETELATEFGKTLPPAEAAAKAKEAASAFVQDRRAVNEMIGAANTAYTRAATQAGGPKRTMRGDHAIHGKGRSAMTVAENSRQIKKAERRAAAGMGAEGTFAGRISDYLLDIGIRNEKLNLDELLKEGGNLMTDNEVLRNYADTELKGGLNALEKLRKRAFIGEDEVRAVQRDVLKGDKKAIEQARKFAGLDEKDSRGNYIHQIVDQGTADKLRDAQITKSTGSSKELLSQHKKYGGKSALTAEQLDKDPNQRAILLNELRNNDQFMADMEKQALGANKHSYKQLADKAETGIATAREGKDELARQTDSVGQGLLFANNKDVLRTSTFDTFKALQSEFGVNLSADQQKAIFAAVSDTSPEGKKNLNKLLKDTIKNKEAREIAQQTFGAFQAAISAAPGDTLGLSEVPGTAPKKPAATADAPLSAAQKQENAKLGVPDKVTPQQKEIMDRLATDPTGKKFEKEMTAFDPTVRNAMLTLPDAAAVELFNKFDPEAKKSGLKQLEGAQTNAWLDENQKKNAARLHAAITKAEKEKDSPDVKQTAAGVQQTAGDVKQKVDTLEISAQTVIIKGGKVEGAVDGKASAPGSATGKPAAELPTNVADVNKEMDAIVQRMKGPGMLGKLFGSNKLSFANKEDEERYHALRQRKQELAAADGGTPTEEPKADGSLKDAVPAPTPAPAEPDKVQQANDAQLKHDTGNATNEPAAAQETTSDDPMREKYAQQVARAEKTQELSKKAGTSAVIDKATKKLTDAQEKLAAYDAAKASGIEWNEKENDYVTVARENGKPGVPVSVNGKAVDPAALSQEQRDRVIQLLKTKKGLGENNFSSADAEMLAKYTAADKAATTGGKKTAADAPTSAAPAAAASEPPAPPSMTSLIDAAKASSVGQAVLHGATALYETFAPDAAANSKVANTPAHREQMRHQDMYVHWQKKLKEAKTPEEREAAQSGIDRSVKLMGEHNAARAAGVDTVDGITRDEHAQTINGKKVKNADVDRHVRLLKEKIAKDPNSILSDAIKEKHGLGTPAAETVKAKNEAEMQKTAGVSSANVAPEKAAQQAREAAEQANAVTNAKDAHTPDAEQGKSGVGRALSDAISEAAPQAAAGVSAANRVHSISADAVFGQASGGGSSAALGAGGAQSGSMTINGTLTLSGLQEAIISAQGAQVMQTEGGAPVVIDPPTTPKAAANSNR